MTTSTLHIAACTEPAELYRLYDGQSQPQPAYIELDLREAVLRADWNAEVGNAVPAAVYHGFERRYPIPVLTAAAANRVMEELRPLATRIVADWEDHWNGSNRVARLGEDGQAAEAEITEKLGLNLGFGDLGADTQGFEESDLVAQWDLDGATTGDEAGEYEITADTTDERLDEIAEEITASLAEVSASGVAVVHGLNGHLAGIRDELGEEAGRMSDAEFRVVREGLGLTGDWLADHLGVNPRTVRHWEQGKYQVPYGIAKALRGLVEETGELVEETVAEALAQYASGPALKVVVYRTDEEYLASNPEPARSASWHRAMIARVAQQVPVTITYQA